MRNPLATNNVVGAIILALVCTLMHGSLASAQETRIKDLANIRGVRSNQLVGFGLVIGLKGTGDSKKAISTNQAVAAMLTNLGQKARPEDVASGSAAAVVATADLPAFSRIGDTLDVKISAVGDAKSLAGGMLVMTPLRAGDGEIYAVAQGSVVVGQASGEGPQVLTVARAPLGASVEKEFNPVIAPNGRITLSLKQPDFTTNARLTEAINTHFKGFFATSMDPATVEVSIPPLFDSRLIEFISELENLTLVVDRKAVVVLNERTGTVVMGSEVTIAKVTVTHGDLSIQVGKSQGKDKTATRNNLATVDGTTVGKLVETLNALGVKPADLVGIVQAIHAAGALQAELKFI